MSYRQPAPADMLWQVKAPHFCAGLVTRGTEVVEAAPILRWAVGQSRASISRYFRAKRWRVVLAARL